MSFWEGLLAAAIGKAVVDYREENKKAQQWNDLFDKLLALQNEMSAFLEKMGLQNTLVVLDPDVIEAGEAGLMQERMRLNGIKAKITEFVSLGGHVEHIVDYEEIDFYLTQLKKLIRLDILEEQDSYLGLYMPEFDFAIMIPYYFKQYDDIFERMNAVYRYLDEQEVLINSKLAITSGQEYLEWQQTKEHLMKLQEAIRKAREESQADGNG